MTTTDPLVSVVTPVFNTEAYLAECIESVLAQSYRNWEYVILDNKSSDRSAALARDFARKDRRIRFVQGDVHLEQEPNYNRALRLISASSQYCKVVQADDWLFPECLERLVSLAEAAPAVGIVGCYLLRGTHVSCQGLPHSDCVVPGRDACRLHLLRRLSLFGTPTSMLYRSDAVRSRYAFYPEASLVADTEVCYDILKERDFGFVHQVLACFREQDGSITSGIEGYNPYLLHELILLRKYGPHYLTAAELGDRWKTLSRQYFRFLGGRVLRRSDSSFWEYHRRGWEAMGYRMTRMRLTGSALLAMADLALNPKSTLERLLDHHND